ncbi:MAG: hypothetical protein B1H13_02425 [Desulfobacteraceae bacterium 4484_190.3]|nr:MAG: hypothetical protein B1H13_02425 [Desulfobacteraceae bacterium 4484_190.3]
MLSKIWLINILLAVCVSFFGIKAYGVWSGEKKAALEMQPVETRKAKPVRKSKKRISKKVAPPEIEYDVVVSKNLFSPERTEAKPDKAKESPKAKAKDPKADKLLMASLKKIVLYGVVIADDYKSALVTDVKTSKVFAKSRYSRHPQKGAKKELIWVKVGDDLGDFKVADIMEDRVLLKNGSKSYDILLYDENKSKIRSTTPNVAKKPPVKRVRPVRPVRKTRTSATRK